MFCVLLYNCAIVQIFKKILFSLVFFLRGGVKRRREGKNHRCERETSIGCLSHAPQLGGTHNPGKCPESNLRDKTQPTEPHWLGLYFNFNMFKFFLDQSKITFKNSWYIDNFSPSKLYQYILSQRVSLNSFNINIKYTTFHSNIKNSDCLPGYQWG